MENKEYFLKKIKINESKILELEAQNAKFRRYVENDYFPKKNGRKPKKSENNNEKTEKKEEKTIIDMF